MKKVLIITLALVFTMSLVAFSNPVANPAGNTTASSLFAFQPNNTPPNEVGIAKMLIETGVVDENASQDDLTKAVNDYIKQKLAYNPVVEKSTLLNELEASGVDQSDYGQILNGRKLSKSTTDIDGLVEQPLQPVDSEDKLLILLADFSVDEYDVGPLNNQITKPGPEDNTSLWVSDFSPEHYKKMLFTEGGYDAIDQNGNTLHLDSMVDYYLEQSGGRYKVDGDVFGWYTLPHSEAYYGDDADGGTDNKLPGTPYTLVDDLLKIARANNVPLQDYDQDGDGLVDHLVIVHAGVDQSGGGGAQGDNAIWAHSSAAPIKDPVTGETVYQPYIIQGEDGGIGVFCHEFGHNIGLPDEYDTMYSGTGEPVGFYSLMSSGSWTGKPLGTMPSPLSPWARIALGWATPTVVNYDDITDEGIAIKLDEATSKGENSQVVRVDLPNKVKEINTPYEGSYSWYGGRGDEIDTTLKTNVDFSGYAAGSDLKLDFWTWYDIEESWDFGFVQISEDNGATWKSLSTSRTTDVIDPSGYPAIYDNLPGYTGNSGGWVNEVIDLSSYAGKNIMLQFRYMTDWASTMDGFFVDNIKVLANGNVIIDEGAETPNAAWTADGWIASPGYESKLNYYLVEWRNHNNTDNALEYAYNFVSDMTVEFYETDPGMLLWYRDTTYTDNWVGMHPGHCFLGIVDAHDTILSEDGVALNTRLQINDAAFNVDRGGDKIFTISGDTKLYPSKQAVPEFYDYQTYWDNKAPSSGIIVPKNGVKIRVAGHSADNTVGEIIIYR